jgi:hypothetical protein
MPSTLCRSSVFLTDHSNEGNNRATIQCQLVEGHTGKHVRSFTRLGKYDKQGEVVVEWDRNIDDREEPDDHEIGGRG